MVSLTINQLSDLNPLFNFFAWWFLPGYVSSLALTLFYRLRPSYRPPPLPPQPTGPNKKPVFDPIYEMSKLAHLEQAKRHQTVAHASVILVYLIYTVLSTYHQQSGSNYYSTLGLKSNSIAFNLPLPGTPPKVNVKKPQVVPDGLLDESGLKSHWRKLAKAFHPDKINPPSDLGSEQEIDEWKNEIESKFIEMREAYETLSDGTKQWAYNRFGPTITTWKNCITLREYLLEGVKFSAPFYAITITSLSLIGTVRKHDPGTFWRWTVLFGIITVEALLITSVSSTLVSTLLSYIFPNRATFEHIALLRQIFVAASCVATQLGGIRYPPPPKLDKTQNVGELVAPILPLLDRAQAYSTLANTEVVKMMYNDLYPILNDHGELAPARRLSVASGAAEVMSQEEGVAAEGKEKQVEEEEGLMNEAIKVLKEKMLDTFCDLRLQSDETGRAAWNQAIREEAKRQKLDDA